MNQDNWIKAVLAFFIVCSFFGGYYIGASEVSISLDMDNNTAISIDKLTKMVDNMETIPDVMLFPAYDCDIIYPFIGEPNDIQIQQIVCNTRSYKDWEE